MLKEVQSRVLGEQDVRSDVRRDHRINLSRVLVQKLASFHRASIVDHDAVAPLRE